MNNTSITPKTVIKWAFLVTSVTLLVIGFVTGAFDDVRARAVRICMECIGIG